VTTNRNQRWLGRMRRGRAKLADRLLGDAVSGRVSRRDLIRGGTVAGLSVPLAGSILAAGGGGLSKPVKAGASPNATLDSYLQAASSVLPIPEGGTGQTTAEGAFDALSPMTATGDMVYRAAAGAVRLPIGTTFSEHLVVLSSGVPGWVAAVVNVQAYGAAGNGMTDDTSAIQAALNATPPGGVCLFPAPPANGYYLISAPLVVPGGISVLGPAVAPPAKQRSSSNYTPAIIKPGNGTNLNAVISDTSWTSTATTPAPAGGILIQGIVVDGNAANQDSTTVGSGSSGGSIADIASWSSPSKGVLDTGTIPAGAPASGYAAVQVGSGPPATVAYTGKSGNSLTGCSYIGGGSGTVATGGTITFGLGHGIVLMGSGNALSNCGAQNTPGAGLVFADQSLAGNNLASATIENGSYGCRTFKTGTYGIWVQHYVGSTDGYLYDCIVDQYFTGSASYAGIQMDGCAGWRIVHNHVYAVLGDGYDLSVAAGAWIESNRVDNFGSSGASGTNYYGYNVSLVAPGCTFTGNQTLIGSTGGGSAGSWTHFAITSGTSAMVVEFAHNIIQQTISGTATGYEFTGGSGGLAVKGVAGPFVGPAQVGTIQNVSGNVTFPDYAGTALSVLLRQAPSVTMGLSGAFGALSTVSPDSGFSGILPLAVAIVWGGTFGSETATAQIVVTYSDNSTDTLTLGGVTTTQTQSLTDGQRFSLLKDGVSITKIQVQAKTTASSTSVTCTAEIGAANTY
jgi:hypothetical protein